MSAADMWAAMKAGNLRSLTDQMYPEAKAEPEYGPCDVCQKNPGARVIKVTGIDTCICDDCSDDEYRQMRRLPRFRTNDDRDAYEAGVRARGEI